MLSAIEWLKCYLLDIESTPDIVLPYYAVLDRKHKLVVKHIRELSTVSPRYFESAVFRRKCYWMGLYICLSLLLIVDRKYTMQHLPFPCAMTALHAFFNIISLLTLWLNGTFRPRILQRSEVTTIFCYSFLHSLNLVLSNAWLEHAFLPVHQAVRSLEPLIVVAISVAYLKKRHSTSIYLCLILIWIGVLLTTVSDYRLGFKGLLAGLLTTGVASWKTIYTTSILRKPYSRLSPLDLLFYISPLTLFHVVFISVKTGEASQLGQLWRTMDKSYLLYLQLVVSGLLAVSLNVVTFNANKYTGAVAMSVAENLKRALTLGLATIFFRAELNAFNGTGLIIVLVGGVLYGQLEYRGKQDQKNFESPPGTPDPDHSPDREKLFS